MTIKRERSARHTAERTQRIAARAAADKAAATPPLALTAESAGASCYSLDDLPEWCDPRINPTEVEKVAHLCVMQHVGENTFDSDGKQLTGRAIIPTCPDPRRWQEFNDAYTTENLEKHNQIAEARRFILEDAAAPRRAARNAKRQEVLAKLKAAQE
jgi:hypothetical protein